MRFLLLVIALLVAGSSAHAADAATHILVDKSSRKLFVYADQAVIATYRVVLGGNPEGHKVQEGDRRTPEGNYVLDYKNKKSSYFLSIHISYPDQTDRKKASALGVSPGGDIMIHGQPNNRGFRQYVDLHARYDWTDGCIALSNQDMKTLWDLVSVPMPIEIRP